MGIHHWFNIGKPVIIIHPTNRINKENHMTLSVDAEKSFEKIQHPLMIKNKNETSNRKELLQPEKDYLQKPITKTSYLMAKDCFPLKSGNNTRISGFTTPVQHFAGDSSQCNKARKRNQTFVTEYPKEFTKQITKTEFSKIRGCKIKMEKSITFFTVRDSYTMVLLYC